MKRAPGTGELIAVWNDHSGRFPFPKDHQLYGGRTPLVSAVSRDEGKSWAHFKTVEANPEAGYAYVAIGFQGRYAFLAYWMVESRGGAPVQSLRVRRVGLDWFVR
jgi:hypothetical protein